MVQYTKDDVTGLVWIESEFNDSFPAHPSFLIAVACYIIPDYLSRSTTSAEIVMLIQTQLRF